MCLFFKLPATCTPPLSHNMHKQSLGEIWPHSERSQARGTQKGEACEQCVLPAGSTPACGTGTAWWATRTGRDHTLSVARDTQNHEV